MGKTLIACIVGIAITLVAASASAESSEPAPLKVIPDDPPLRRLTLAINPMSALLGRYSVEAQVVPMKHLAITINPVFTHTSLLADAPDGQTQPKIAMLNGFGGEAGVRYYSGRGGAEGFFIGPSLIFSSNTRDDVVGTSRSYLSYGGAVDLGGQVIVGPGIVIGGGAGLMYLTTNKDAGTKGVSPTSLALAGADGLRPRLLFSVGYAF
jgi:hypothetical protein